MTGSAARALVFDCDGVLADTERYGHLPAFNATFEEFGLPVRWTRGGLPGEAAHRRRQGTHGQPAHAASSSRRPGCPPTPAAQQAAIAAWHRRKTEIYAELVASGAVGPAPAWPG